MIAAHKVLLAGVALGTALPSAHAAEDVKPPGVEAREGLFDPPKPKNPVQNRFFLKSKRFELTPMAGIVATNPFASRFNFSLGFGYHFRENLALSGIFTYAPDLGKGDVKGLVPLLLQQDPNDAFQQPLEKVTLAAAIGVTWAPVYGKLNILGEVVGNFDFFTFLGLGFVVQNKYYAIENPNYGAGDPQDAFYDFTGPPVTQVAIAPTVGFGTNFFLTQTVALRLDARLFLYPDANPDYNPDDDIAAEGTRLVTELSTSVGVAFFFPKMKPRLDDF
ncbi:MAG: outer membrane beta-barrel domain-containing protein [Alphaproteobacteria bacterium]|nr:outer membrane beta-barrel domain-containing protein [Alphaproteobacteria bacterium]